jgi:lipopolysaccharide export system protein LptC
MSSPASPPSSDSRADAERVVSAMAQWRRRSRFIRIFRIGLPAAMAVVALILLGWVAVKSFLSSLPDLASRGAIIRMTNPRFYGQDQQGRSFVLAAKEAVREAKGSEGVITLFSPNLRLSTGPTRKMEVTGKTGVFDQATRAARLTGQVKVSDQASGFRFETGEALIDTKTGTVPWTDQRFVLCHLRTRRAYDVHGER